MKLKDISKEELQTMGYDEIAYLVLENKKKKMKIFDLFKDICELLELPVETVEDRITDFFELLSTNKKFVLLEDGFWDLSVNHVQDIVIEDEEDDPTLDEIEDDEMDLEGDSLEDDEDIFYNDDLDAADDDDDDLKDLVIIDDDDSNQE